MTGRLIICTLLIAFTCIGQAKGDIISEFDPNPQGSDPSVTTFELSGTASAMFDLWIVSIESDTTSPLGVVDRASAVSGTYDANGLAVVTVPDFENPSFTVVLLDEFTGTVGTTDVDTNDDGMVDDTSAFTGVMDAIFIPDNTADESVVYGTDFGGVNMSAIDQSGSFSTEPEVAFRDMSTGDWYVVNTQFFDGQIFDSNGNDVLATGGSFSGSGDGFSTTYGRINPTFTPVPEPSSCIVLFGLASGLVMRRRR